MRTCRYRNSKRRGIYIKLYNNYITMVTHLYKNFITDEIEYLKNIDLWKTVIYTLLSVENLTFTNYLQTTKKDGSLYMDGNPIFSFKIINSNKAVRIIQEEIETDNVEFSAWLDSIEVEENKIDELVISLELSQESLLLAIELINAWVINDFSKEKMNRFIDKLFTLKDLVFNNQIEVKKEFA